MIIYLYTETTGLRPGEICQLSYILHDEKEIKTRNFYFTVDYIEPSAVAVHGLTTQKLQKLSNGKRFEDSFLEIFNDLTNADLIVAHNTAFDFSFIRVEFEKLGQIIDESKGFCSMKNAVTLCKLPRPNSKGYKYPKLSELTTYLGITDQEILLATKKLFGSDCSFHDARFDTTAVYLACERARRSFSQFSIINDYI
ncbi:MAG: 3'-5' exonuclease [Clostridia bacterium]|nr:3'-5' exonuclease [Clostridia bacterium]